MSQLQVRARNDIRTSQRSITKQPIDVTKSHSLRMPDMLFPGDLNTPGADQSFYVNGHRIIDTGARSTDFVKRSRSDREKFEPRMLDPKMYTSPAQQDAFAPSTHRKNVPIKRLPSTCSLQSPLENILPALDIKAVSKVRPSIFKDASQSANQTKASAAPLYVSKADDNTLPPLVINAIHNIKNNKVPLKDLSNGDKADCSRFRKLESEAAIGTGLSYAEGADFEHIEHVILKDIRSRNETRNVPPKKTLQTLHGNDQPALPTLKHHGEVISKSSQTLPLTDNVGFKDGKRHIKKDNADFQALDLAPSVTRIAKQQLSPRSSHVAMATLPPIGGSPKMNASLPPDVVSSISLECDPILPGVPESSSRKDTHHVKQSTFDYLLHTSIRNKEKEGRVQPKVLHPQQVFRELNLPKDIFEMCYQPNTDNRYDRWGRTNKNGKKRRVSMSSDEEEQQAVAEFHKSILRRQQKAVEDAITKSQTFSHGVTDSCKFEPTPKSAKRHRKNKRSLSKASAHKPVLGEAGKHLDFEGAAGTKPTPYKGNTLSATLHKTPDKGTTLGKRKSDALPTPQDELKLHGYHLLNSTERPESFPNAHAMKSNSLPPNSMVRDTSAKMSLSTGDKSTRAMTGSDLENGSAAGEHTEKPRGRTTLKSTSGRIKESGSRMRNNQASSTKARIQTSPSVVSLTPVMYDPALTSPFTFSMFQLPSEHKDNDAIMKTKASILKKNPKKKN